MSWLRAVLLLVSLLPRRLSDLAARSGTLEHQKRKSSVCLTSEAGGVPDPVAEDGIVNDKPCLADAGVASRVGTPGLARGRWPWQHMVT
eukprot:2174522-Rhodomonas_salina.2